MNSSCSICLATFTQSCHVFSTTCAHIFHQNCIERWLGDQTSCPQCRKRCQRSELRRIYLSNEGKDTNHKIKPYAPFKTWIFWHSTLTCTVDVYSLVTAGLWENPL